jgi:hypothetical protein
MNYRILTWRGVSIDVHGRSLEEYPAQSLLLSVLTDAVKHQSVQFVVIVVNHLHFHLSYIAYLRTSSSLGTPPIQYFMIVFYPFALDDGDRLAPIAVDLVDRLAILVVVRRFSRMGAADSRFLRSKVYMPS